MTRKQILFRLESDKSDLFDEKLKEMNLAKQDFFTFIVDAFLRDEISIDLSSQSLSQQADFSELQLTNAVMKISENSELLRAIALALKPYLIKDNNFDNKIDQGNDNWQDNNNNSRVEGNLSLTNLDIDNSIDNIQDSKVTSDRLETDSSTSKTSKTDDTNKDSSKVINPKLEVNQSDDSNEDSSKVISPKLEVNQSNDSNNLNDSKKKKTNQVENNKVRSTGNNELDGDHQNISGIVSYPQEFLDLPIGIVTVTNLTKALGKSKDFFRTPVAKIEQKGIEKPEINGYPNFWEYVSFDSKKDNKGKINRTWKKIANPNQNV